MEVMNINRKIFKAFDLSILKTPKLRKLLAYNSVCFCAAVWGLTADLIMFVVITNF